MKSFCNTCNDHGYPCNSCSEEYCRTCEYYGYPCFSCAQEMEVPPCKICGTVGYTCSDVLYSHSDIWYFVPCNFCEESYEHWFRYPCRYCAQELGMPPCKVCDIPGYPCECEVIADMELDVIYGHVGRVEDLVGRFDPDQIELLPPELRQTDSD